MLMTLATLALLVQATGRADTDTTVAVHSGARLDVNNFGGEIVVRTWNQNNVRVRATHSSRSRVDVSSTASAVLIRTAGRRGPPSIVDLELTVPAAMAMSLTGHYTDITVEGAGGTVSAESTQGDITVTGGAGSVVVKAVEGDVTLTRTRGRIQVTAIEGEVRVSDAVGELTIETVDGDVTLLRLDSPSVDVNTVDGDVVYDGTIKDGGSYRLYTHDGDLTVAIAANANVRVTVATLDGAVDWSFPVEVQREGKHRFNFTLGTGKARLDLETFDGDIRVVRPGELQLEQRKQDQDKHHDLDFDFDFDFDYKFSRTSDTTSGRVKPN